MNSQEDIRRILLEILRVGLLRIRSLGQSGLAEACSLEADHLHNLPVLLRSFSREQLLFYYNVERIAFMDRTETGTDFRPLWGELEVLIQAELDVPKKQ